jgi:hypothetical protein
VRWAVDGKTGATEMNLETTDDLRKLEYELARAIQVAEHLIANLKCLLIKAREARLEAEFHNQS